NLYHTGEWTGDPANTGTFRVRPVAGIAGNSLQLLTANLTPPVFPWAPEWNKSIPEIPFVKNGFPRFSLQTGEIQMEESAGAGFGLFLFCLLVLFAGIFQKKKGYNLSMMVK